MQVSKMLYKGGNAISNNMTVFYFQAFKLCFAAAFHRIAITAFFPGLLYQGNIGRFQFTAAIELPYPNAQCGEGINSEEQYGSNFFHCLE